ncbi:MAG TPA: D-alanyl-D-alanine carboxypeptidase family protein [Baekduia sp.]|nr:D-alanyl-D-alanine carboxypeptidase family protein [Baekduia sp.]
MSVKRSPMRRFAAIACLTTGFATVVGVPVAVAAPNVSAPAAILVEPATGDIVFQRNATERRPIASTTKMMTALVALENADLDKVVTTVPYNGLAVESTGGFRGGERVTIRTLLQAMLVASANDAANTLAVRIGGSQKKFVAMMNARARAAGLTDTHFANPIGLDAPGNYSSATDLVKIALLLRRDPFIKRTVDSRSVTVRSGGRTRTLRTRNLLLNRVPYINGVKTGHTLGSGWVLVSSAKRDGVTLVSAVLGAGSEAARMNDTMELMRYGLGLYATAQAVTANKVYARVKLRGRDEQVDLIAGDGLSRTVRRGYGFTLRPVVPAELDGPLAARSKVGVLNVLYRGRVVGSVPLLVSAAVTAAPVSTGPSALVILLLILASVLLASCTLMIILGRRRAVRRRQRVASADSEARTA